MATEKLLDVEIVTPGSVVFNGKAVSISLPGSLSPFQVLYNHAPIVSSLENGTIKIIDDTENAVFFKVSKGFAEVRNNLVSILVDTAEIISGS